MKKDYVARAVFATDPIIREFRCADVQRSSHTSPFLNHLLLSIATSRAIKPLSVTAQFSLCKCRTLHKHFKDVFSRNILKSFKKTNSRANILDIGLIFSKNFELYCDLRVFIYDLWVATSSGGQTNHFLQMRIFYFFTGNVSYWKPREVEAKD